MLLDFLLNLPSMRSQCPVTIHNKTMNAETSNDAISAGVKRPQHPKDILKEDFKLKPLLHYLKK